VNVSSTEILANLPALSPAELEAVWQRAGQLLEGSTLSASPELLAAVEEADASWAEEDGESIDEVRRKIRAWLGK
jgi:hypothetical protein